MDNKMLLKTNGVTQNLDCVMGGVTQRTVLYVVMLNTRETDVRVTLKYLLAKSGCIILPS